MPSASSKSLIRKVKKVRRGRGRRSAQKGMGIGQARVMSPQLLTAVSML